MKTIYGRVLVKESNAGVPNLVVAAYDSERGIQNISAVPVIDNASALLTERLGKRIGSVLTGQDGTFTFSFDDTHFSGNDLRPDLLIVVFAPEDTQGLTNPYPLPAEQRVLYVSRTPRADAGSEESYMIRLLQAQLDNFSISAPSISPSVKSAEINNANFAADIENSYISREHLKQLLAPRLQTELDKTTAFRNRAKEKLKEFSAIPLPLRGSPLLVKDASQVPDVQKNVITQGVTRLNNYKGGLRLQFTPDELSSLNLTPDSSTGKAKGQVNRTDLMNLVMAKAGGVRLVRVRGFSNTLLLPDALDKKYSVPSSPPVPAPAPDNPTKKPLGK